MILSSSSVQDVFLISGLRWLCHLSRHCFPIRPFKCLAINVQRLGPYLRTNSMTCSSSSFVQGPVQFNLQACKNATFGDELSKCVLVTQTPKMLFAYTQLFIDESNICIHRQTFWSQTSITPNVDCNTLPLLRALQQRDRKQSETTKSTRCSELPNSV